MTCSNHIFFRQEARAKRQGQWMRSSRDHAGNGSRNWRRPQTGGGKGWYGTEVVKFVIEKAATRRARSAACADSARNHFNEARTALRHTTGCTEPGRRRQPSFARMLTRRTSKQNFNRRCRARCGASPRRRPRFQASQIVRQEALGPCTRSHGGRRHRFKHAG
jgi:hypothetical protein